MALLLECADLSSFSGAPITSSVSLFDRKEPAKMEERDLADPTTDALATHQPIGEVALAGDFVRGSRLTDEHARDITGK